INKQHRFTGAAQHGLPRLFDVRALRRSEWVIPTAAAFAPANAAQPTHNKITFILRRATPTPIAIIPRFRADPYSVKVGGLTQHFIAALVKIIVPLWVFDYYYRFGIHPPGCGEHALLRKPGHQFAMIILPHITV